MGSSPGIANKIISFSTYSKVGNYTDRMVAVVSGLQMVIPFLAFSIIQGGVGGFMHLAGTITGASQAAASQAANEVVTGNKSFDNYSSGNVQMHNHSGFKTDMNSSYAAGGSSYQHMDGAIEKVTPHGNTFMMTGAGTTMSSGSGRINMGAEMQEDARQAYNHEFAHGETLRDSLEKNRSSQYENAVSWAKQVIAKQDAGTDVQYEKLGNNSEIAKEFVEHVRNNEASYSDDKSQTGSLKTGVEASTPKFIGASANISATYDTSHSSSQGLSEQDRSSKGDNAEKSFTALEQAMQSEKFNDSVGIDKNLNDNIHANYTESQNLHNAIEKHESELHNLQQSQQKIDSFTSRHDIDASHLVEQKLIDGGMSLDKAHSAIDNPSNLSLSDMKKLNIAKGDVKRELMANMSPLKSEDPMNKYWDNYQNLAEDRQEFVSVEAQKLINQDTQNRTNVTNTASQNGVSENKVQNRLDNSQQDLNKKANDKINTAQQKATQMKSDNEDILKDKQENMNQAEEDRHLKWAFGRDKPKN